MVEVERIELRDSPIVGKGYLVVTVAADVTREMIELPEKELIEGISSDVGEAIARAIIRWKDERRDVTWQSLHR